MEQSFNIPVGVETAWAALLDVERLAPCLPGAALESVEGDAFTGIVKIKVGPINMTYRGEAKFTEKDEKNYRATIEALGRDARGNGTARATICVTLEGRGDQTSARLTTDLDLTGKPAQFGRGVVGDVSDRLIAQFASALAAELGGSEAANGRETSAPLATGQAGGIEGRVELGNGGGPRAAASHTASEPVPLDLMRTVWPVLLKRVAPIAAALAIFGLALFLRRARASRS